MGHNLKNDQPVEDLDTYFDHFVVDMLYDNLPRSLNDGFLVTEYERREWHNVMLPELPEDISHYCIPNIGPGLIWGTLPNSWNVIQTRKGSVDVDVCFYPTTNPVVIYRITLIFLRR